jgi:hypothetical protein
MNENVFEAMGLKNEKKNTFKTPTEKEKAERKITKTTFETPFGIRDKRKERDRERENSRDEQNLHPSLFSQM